MLCQWHFLNIKKKELLFLCNLGESCFTKRLFIFFLEFLDRMKFDKDSLSKLLLLYFSKIQRIILFSINYTFYIEILFIYSYQIRNFKVISRKKSLFLGLIKSQRTVAFLSVNFFKIFLNFTPEIKSFNFLEQLVLTL